MLQGAGRSAIFDAIATGRDKVDRPQTPLDEAHRVASDFFSVQWAWIVLVILSLLGAVYVAKAVIAPVAFSLFLIAMV